MRSLMLPTTRTRSEAPAVVLLRLLLRPFGYLAFVFALAALSASARLLGEDHELGFFSNRLARTIWRYPEVTRRGVQMAWVVWAVLFAAAISDETPWDERALGAIAVIALWRQLAARYRGTADGSGAQQDGSGDQA